MPALLPSPPPEQEGCRRLHGDLDRLGVSVESHESTLPQPVAWERGFRENSLEFCLNLSGTAEIHGMKGRSGTVVHAERTTGLHGQGKPTLRAVRRAYDAHSFVTIQWSREHLAAQLRENEDNLHRSLRDWLAGGKRQTFVTEAVPMSPADEHLCAALCRPPVPAAARGLWYQAKVTESMARLFFAADPGADLFCRRLNRLARDRAERAAEVLRRDLSAPPTLEALGREVGCSPFYLSRTFHAVMGRTISQYLREERVRRAAELLRAGGHNVTEAALEVGYNSIGHFSTAFCHVTGCCPTLYLKAPHLAKPGF